jgi:phosphate transport system substrate-binding protein
VAQNYGDGAIGYVNYSYALQLHFPVAKMLNAADYYTEPTPQNVAVSLLKAQINNDPNSPNYLTQQLEGVYADPDPRTYPLSSYSYMILPAALQGRFSTDKGKTLGAFSYFAMCQGQQESASLGYSPMPINLVQASFEQIRKIPGVVVQNINIQSCHNPTFSPDGTNTLANTAPMPQACDKRGPTQCLTGTGGAVGRSTPPTKAGGGSGGTTPRTGGGNGNGGTGTGTTNPSGTNLAAGPAASTDQAQQCDPDTGTCGSGTGNGPSSGDATANPFTLATAGGWTGTRTLMVLAALFTVALVLGPGIASRFFAKRRAK